MWFRVDPAAGTPLYQQIIEEIKTAIQRGALAPGERLPSVRQLSLDLTVNPNTVARAYLELEREGFITTARGTGTFVADHPPVPEEDPAATLRTALRRALAEALRAGLSREEVLKVISSEIQQWLDTRADKAAPAEE
ncbi:MAG: GntR family transcriptional regulator [Clostridia bacterium]|nr:MAG: GntR family transcriptional regulator [Clostridia bacterium]